MLVGRQHKVRLVRREKEDRCGTPHCRVVMAIWVQLGGRVDLFGARESGEMIQK
jgi:hypothetical protein